MSTKILCPVDGTEHCKSAIALAAQMANAMHGELTLIAVNELMGGSSIRAGAAAYVWDEAEIKKVLSEAANEAKDAGATDLKTVSVKSRDVPRAISFFAEDNGFDHIVIGSSGKGGLKRLMLGSVSHDVVSRAHCPVTISR